MFKFLMMVAVAGLFVSCSSTPTRESYCQSLSTKEPISEPNAFESVDQALKKQKTYCEPDVAINEEEFRKNFAVQKEKHLKEQCKCEVVIFKAYEKGFGVGQGQQTSEDWAPLCESVGLKKDFERGVRQGLVLKKQMETEFEIIQKMGYSSDQIKQRCTYSQYE